MNELLVIFIIFLSGLGMVRLCLKSEYPMFNAASAFPLGLVGWFLSYILVYGSLSFLRRPIPFTVADVRFSFGIFCCFSLILISLTLFQERVTWQEFFVYVAIFSLFAVSHFCLRRINILVVNAEPYGMIDIETNLSTFIRGGIPIFNHTIFSLSALIGDDYIFATFPQYTAISLSLLMCYVTFGELRKSSHSLAYSLILSFFPMAILFSSYVGVWQLFYTNHHLLAATFVFLFAASCWLAITKQTPTALIIGTISLIAFSFTRMEGLLCAIAIFCIFLSMSGVSLKDQRKMSLLFLLGITPWSAYLISVLGIAKEGKVGSGMQHAAIWGLAAASTLCFQVNRWKAWQRVLCHFYKFVPAAVWLILILFTRLKSEHMLFNIHVSLLSLFNDTRGMWYNPMNIDADQHGGWGNTWFFILGATILILALRPPSKQTRFIDAFGLSGLTATGLIIAIIYFALPYYAGLTDSANRIFFHFTPLLLIWAVIQLGVIFTGKNEC